MFSPDKVVFEETIAQTSRVCQNHTVTFHSESWGSRPHQRANADSQRESERTPSLCYIRPSRLWTCSSSGWQRAGPQEARLTLREWVRPLIWVSVRGREQGDLPAQTSTSTDSDSLNTWKFHENYKKGMIGKGHNYMSEYDTVIAEDSRHRGETTAGRWAQLWGVALQKRFAILFRNRKDNFP